jgi:hypothetical protein
LLLTQPRQAEAQFEDLVSGLQEINFSVSCWSARGALERKSGCIEELHGFGVEGLWRLYELKLADQPAPDTLNPDAPIRGPYIQLELAVGYGQFSGFASEDPTVELRGSVRELPSISLYATLQNDSPATVMGKLQPYVGLRSGLIELKNLQLYDALQPADAAAYTGSGESFQIGVVGGLSVTFGPVTPFAEASLTKREFPSVEWSLVNDQVHHAAPRSMSFSGWSYALGVQVNVR